MERNKVKEIYERPLLALLSEAHLVHIQNHPIGQIQKCALISFKTGGCPENCKYCSQSANYKTEISPQSFLRKEAVMERALQAIGAGATRICLGAAWREVREGRAFETLLECVKELSSTGVEVCCTLGMLKREQAKRLKEHGLFAYNHNLDTSPEFYPHVVTTRTYEERLQTLDVVDEEELSTCCGGILGLGESEEDRISLIWQIVSRKKIPDSIPINLLSPVPGTPFEKNPPVPIWDVLRICATLRILAPHSKIRLSAGRVHRSFEEQALCFFVGVNSLFIGEKMLTEAVPNPSYTQDEEMFHILGLK